MVNIEETDFRTLDEFPIKWWWTDSRWIKLSEATLKNIQPFTDKKRVDYCIIHLSLATIEVFQNLILRMLPELMRLVIHLKSNNGY